MKIPFAAVFTFAAMTLVTNAAADCTGAVSGPWDQKPGYTVGAFAQGSDCAKAVAVIVVRDAEGTVVHHESYIAEHVMVLAGASTPAELTKALGDWTDMSHPAFATTASLPDWAEGADSPVNGEFPFYPAEGIDREVWNRIRAAKSPVFCYVQGMESLACIADDPELGFYPIGVQTFPG